MNRGERREKSKRKWISRARKVYNALGYWYVPLNGIKSGAITRKNRKPCESIVDFLNDSKYAKILKNCTVPYKSVIERWEDKYRKIQKKKERYSAKQEAKKEAEEFGKWEYTCGSCIHFNYGTCDKNYKNLKGGDCPDFYD